MERVIIAGSRDMSFHMREPLKWLDGLLCMSFGTLHPHYDLEIVSGNSGNVDLLGERWAKWAEAKLTLFPADWETHGRAAGPIRNRQMADYAGENGRGALVLIWDGKSWGSTSMLREATKAGLRLVQVVIGARR